VPDGESQGTVNRNAGSNLWCATTSLAWIAFWILVLFMRKCLRAVVRSTASPPFGAWRVSQLHLFSWRRNSGIATTGLLVAPALRFHPVTGILLEALSPQIEVVRVGLTENWRRGIRVVMRQ
jgi:hypothetical protein